MLTRGRSGTFASGIIRFLFGVTVFAGLVGCASDGIDRGTAVVKNVAADPFGDENWVLGAAIGLSNSDYVATPLVSEKESFVSTASSLFDISITGMEQCGVGSWWSFRSRNILFTNTKLNESKWLFEDNNQFVTDFSPMRRSSFGYSRSEQTDGFSKTILYRVIFGDSNGDKIIDDQDDESLAVSKVDGTGFKVLIDDFERVVHTSETDDALFIIYQLAGEGRSMRIDLDSFEVLSDKELPRVSE